MSESALNSRRTLPQAAEPQIQLGIPVEVAGGLDRECLNLVIRQRREVHLLAGHTLNVGSDQALVRERHEVTRRSERGDQVLVGNEQRCDLRINRGGVARIELEDGGLEKSIIESQYSGEGHRSPPPGWSRRASKLTRLPQTTRIRPTAAR